MIDTAKLREKYARRGAQRPAGSVDVYDLCDVVDTLLLALRESQAMLPVEQQNRIEAVIRKTIV